MQLSKELVLGGKLSAALSLPERAIFDLPERVLQFGSGVLLRGLIDYYIDHANKQQTFNGRIVVVHSIEKERPVLYEQQDYLYTHLLRGIVNGAIQEEAVVNASISRVLLASSDWEKILACAEQPEIEVIISNTTEVGIVLDKTDDIQQSPPASFPGKLLALLYRRYQHFHGRIDKGWTIVPVELITDNGKKLKRILLDLCAIHQLEVPFIEWLNNANYFCDTLVDRIVPGKLSVGEQAKVEQAFGYQDAMTIMSEPYSLWAIETQAPTVHETLRFATVNPGIVITDDIAKYRELKLRLLNGTHTFVCAVAFLCGFETVKAAMADAAFKSFAQSLMVDEILPCIIGASIEEPEALAFAESVLERFENPFIEHYWLSITLNYTYKMQNRNVLLIDTFHDRFGKSPWYMAFSFAAYLLFMRCQPSDKGFIGHANGVFYQIQDDAAAFYSELWKHKDADQLVQEALGNTSFWSKDMNDIPGFSLQVSYFLRAFLQDGIKEVFKNLKNYTPESVA